MPTPRLSRRPARTVRSPRSRRLILKEGITDRAKAEAEAARCKDAYEKKLKEREAAAGSDAKTE